jgi:outer membrane protein assembly factor BamB
MTVAGTHYCPGTMGGVQWNGPAWHPGLGLLFVPTVDWCYTVKLEEPLRYVAGGFYMGGTYDPDADSSGLLTAIDAATGAIRWQYRSPDPMVAGVTATAGGLVLTGELDGTFLALDAADGKVLYRFNTGGSIGGGVVTYQVADRQYIGTTSGHGSIIFGGRGAATIVVFALKRVP